MPGAHFVRRRVAPTMADDAPGPSGASPDVVSLPLKWRTETFELALPATATLADAKAAAAAHTGIAPATLKLLGAKTKAGKPATDGGAVGDLSLKPGVRLMLLGTPAAASAALEAAAKAAPAPDPDVGDDGGDWVASGATAAELDVRACPHAADRLAKRCAAFKLVLRVPPRVGKKMLVLDIDHTLFDLGSTAECAADLARPHLHTMLAAAHPHYDIIIWSANSMKWIEVKMRELRLASHPDFQLTAYMDALAMVTVRTPAHGVFNAKPLEVLWSNLADAHGGHRHWGPHNTIMFDDLRRNYVFNPESGLVVTPYRKAATNRGSDDELLRLTKYLLAIAELPTFDGLRHSRWERWLRKRGRE